MRGLMMLLALVVGLATPAASQETRVAPEGHVPPPATVAQADWLIGDWVGSGIDGAQAAESWLPPSGGTMVGLFVQEKPDGSLYFTEHMYLAEEEGSLVLKLKHFNPDLTGWEEKDGMARFRLLSIEHCAAYFSGLTYRCDGEGGLLVAVRMKGAGSEVEELVFRFKRRAKVQTRYACDGNTLEINECMADVMDRALAQQARYLEAALAHHADRPELATMIRTSDVAYAAYRKQECGAVWEDWKDGSIRTIQSISCGIELTDQRTHDIWQRWLTYMDSTPPVLPEPGPTQ